MSMKVRHMVGQEFDSSSNKTSSSTQMNPAVFSFGIFIVITTSQI